jgi:energy-coupling factor transporter ATP-binding protein EcfA2
MNDERITYFAETDARNKRVKFGIKAKDRSKHVYVIGKTGMGKSTLLENMAVQDIQNGEGMAFIDPHGKTAELLLEYIPKERVKDVVYFAPFDLEHPISFNVLESVGADKRHLVVSGLMSTFKKIWKDAWSARMEYILTNTLLALLEYPDSTLLGVNRMLSEKNFRNDVVSHITDPAVKMFWTGEFANYTERTAAEAVPSIQNKVGQFTANPLIRNLIGQPKSSFDIRKLMDDRKIIIINLSKGKVGDVSANLLGGMLITKIYLAAMSRADVPDRQARLLPNFYLYVDEFQNFANESFADILSEARKYKLNLTVAHQYIEQMEEEVRAAVFGNVGTMVTFRVGAYDAEVLEKEFAPQFTAEDLVNLGFTQIYLKLMIDGVTSQPFSATTMGPIKPPEVTYVDDVIATSRSQFARRREEIENNIAEWMKPVSTTKSKPVTDTQQKIVSSVSKPTPKSEPVTKPATVSTVPAPTPKPVTSKATTPPVRPVTPKPAPPPEGESLSSLLAKVKSAEPKPATQAVEPKVATPSKPKPPRPNDPKVQTKENINQLKDALNSALKGTKPVEKNDPKASTPEVPEEVLRKMLKLE